MNQFSVIKERAAYEKALAILKEDSEQELGEYSLSGSIAQPVPLPGNATEFGFQVAQSAVKPVIDYDTRKISNRVLASMADDPDPGKTLADVRSLLVGPTRSLHDGMFEEVIDILEESDREVQNALQALESNYCKLSDISDDLITASVESRDQNRHQCESFQEELQKSVAGQQQMVSEMFMAIDIKIAELSTQINWKIEGLANKFEATMREAATSQARANQELEAKCLAGSSEALTLLEDRLVSLESKSSDDQADFREIFADGLLNIADRFKMGDHRPRQMPE
jgi:hypothetical protein